MLCFRRFFLFALLWMAAFQALPSRAADVDARLVLLRVLAVDGNNVTLDDKRKTVVKISDKIPFYSEKGNGNFVTDLRAGDQVVLFVDRETKTVLKVSSRRDDIEAAGGKASTPVPEEQPRISYRRVEKSLTEMKPTSGSYSRAIQDATINGQIFDVGMEQWVYARGSDPITVVFRNQGDDRSRFDVIETWIGVAGNAPDLKASFSILGDGKEIYTSPWVDRNTPAIKVSVPVKDYSGVSFVTWSDKNSGSCRAYWANPVFVKLIPERTALRATPRTLPQPSTPTTTITPDEMTVDLRSNPIMAAVNGRAIDFGYVRPVQKSGRVLVPMRAVFEALGASVNYDAASGVILASRGGKDVEMKIGSQYASVNRKNVMLDVPAQAALGRMMVPLRFVAEAFGVNVVVRH